MPNRERVLRLTGQLDGRAQKGLGPGDEDDAQVTYTARLESGAQQSQLCESGGVDVVRFQRVLTDLEPA